MIQVVIFCSLILKLRINFVCIRLNFKFILCTTFRNLALTIGHHTTTHKMKIKDNNNSNSSNNNNRNVERLVKWSMLCVKLSPNLNRAKCSSKDDNCCGDRGGGCGGCVCCFCCGGGCCRLRGVIITPRLDIQSFWFFIRISRDF